MYVRAKMIQGGHRRMKIGTWRKGWMEIMLATHASHTHHIYHTRFTHFRHLTLQSASELDNTTHSATGGKMDRGKRRQCNKGTFVFTTTQRQRQDNRTENQMEKKKGLFSWHRLLPPIISLCISYCTVSCHNMMRYSVGPDLDYWN